MTDDFILRTEREDRSQAEYIRELRESAAETAADVESYNDCEDVEPDCGCHDPCCPCDGAKRGTP